MSATIHQTWLPILQHIAELIWGPHTNAMSKSAAAGSCNLCDRLTPNTRAGVDTNYSCNNIPRVWLHDSMTAANEPTLNHREALISNLRELWANDMHETNCVCPRLRYFSAEQTRKPDHGVLLEERWFHCPAACVAQGATCRFSHAVRVLHGRLLQGRPLHVETVDEHKLSAA